MKRFNAARGAAACQTDTAGHAGRARRPRPVTAASWKAKWRGVGVGWGGGLKGHEAARPGCGIEPLEDEAMGAATGGVTRDKERARASGTREVHVRASTTLEWGGAGINWGAWRAACGHRRLFTALTLRRDKGPLFRVGSTCSSRALALPPPFPAQRCGRVTGGAEFSGHGRGRGRGGRRRGGGRGGRAGWSRRCRARSGRTCRGRAISDSLRSLIA